MAESRRGFSGLDAVCGLRRPMLARFASPVAVAMPMPLSLRDATP